MSKLLQVFLTALILKHTTSVRYFTSSSDIEKLVNIEKRVIRSMRDYVAAEKRRLDYLDKYLHRLKTEYELAKKDVSYYFGNPINAYTIIKRLGPDLQFTEDVIKNKTDLIPPRVALPTNEDLTQSALGIESMVKMYELNVTQLANGVLEYSASENGEVHSETITPMTASDCQTIGMALYMENRCEDAVPWLVEAFKKADIHCKVCPLPVMDIIDHITQCYHQLEDTLNFVEWQEKRIALFPKDPESERIADYIKWLRDSDGEKTKDPIKQERSRDLYAESTKNYMKLCQGVSTKNKSKSLSCYYAHGPHPVLRLAPLRAERLHQDPDITLFHDVLNDDDIAAILALAKPKLWNETSNDQDAYRNAEFINLPDSSSETVARASRRALDLSGLGGEDCEPLKVVNYGIGGLYKPHWDTRQKRRKVTDWDRKGTVLFYLSDVEQGGALTFPLLHTTIFPKKGAAVFWMNLLPSGVRDIWMLHAVCPMLHGAKWVALKWPHEYMHKQWCPVWKTEQGIVTLGMYKKILLHRQEYYKAIIGNDVKSMRGRDYE